MVGGENILASLFLLKDKRKTVPCLLRILLFGGLGVLFGTSAVAKWSVEPSLKTGVSLSDNAGLVSDNGLPAFGKRRHDIISEVTPGLWLKGAGSRYRLNAVYRMQNLFYAQQKQYDVTNNQLEAVGDGEIFRDHLFFDAEVYNYQNPLYAYPGIPADYYLPGNRADITTLKLSPYFRKDFGNTARMVMRYTYEQIQVEKRASDGITRRFNFRMANKRWGRDAWNIRYKKERLERGGFFLLDHETAEGNFRYRFGRRFSLLARAGSENHNLGASTTWTRQYENGNYWAGGVGLRIRRTLRLDTLYGDHFKMIRTTWNPSRRADFELSWRDRDYGMNPGESWRGEFSVRFRRSVWLTSYQEMVVSQQQALSDRGIYSFRNPDTGEYLPGEIDPDTEQLTPVYFDPDTGERIDYPDAGNLTTLVLNDFGLFDETYLRRRGQSVYGWQTGEDAVTALLFYERRNYLEQGDSEQSYGFYGSWKRRLTPVTELLSGGNYQHRIYRFTRFKGTAWSVDAGLLWELSHNTSASCLYRYIDRYAYSRKNRYHENRITCYLKLSM
ncbi:MAG TPA: TIGR03016 family PEP-CTERM system-associated outer membrane protein [Gammaproteobacteria bacterium]|nr:TIGR03016 family PEP-CTERM system-associated outer membrane protein [Gammaproteobacteria bacterium]